MKTLAFINLKGGVGKTVSAANVAHILNVYHHKKVLLVDGDKQGSVSRYFGLYGNQEGTAALLLADNLDAESVGRAVYNYSDFSLRKLCTEYIRSFRFTNT